MEKLTTQQKLQKLIEIDPSRYYSVKIDEAVIDSRWRSYQGGLLLEKMSRKNCNAGTKDAKMFEDVCKEICEVTLENSFKDHSVSFHPHTLAINGLQQRFRDITFPNQPVDTDQSCIWNVLRRDHNVKSFVLECKNYSTSKISRDEIYQLFEYIDPDEHGRLGFLLTRDGEKTLDNTARSAIVRIKKDKYKFIVLSDKDLIEWINAYIDNGSPERFFNKINDSRKGWPV